MRSEIINVQYPHLATTMAVHAGHELLSDILRRRGRYSTGDLSVYELLLRPGDFVVDGGANIGWYTLFAADKVGASGKVVAIEPDSRNAEVLKENIRLHSVSQIEVLEIALGETVGKTHLHLSQGNFGDHFTSDVMATRREHKEVTVTTLEAIIQKEGKNPRLIKLDIQGAEPKALAGMGAYVRPGTSERSYILTEFAPGLILRSGGSPFEILAFIEKNQYMPYRVIDEPGNGRVFVRASVQMLLELIQVTREEDTGCDLLLVPRERLEEWEFLLMDRSYDDGDFDATLEHINAMHSLGRAGPELDFIEAQALLQLIRAPEALPIFEHLYALAPGPQSAFFLSLCLSTLGEFERAGKTLESTELTLRGMSSEYGRYLLRKGKFREGFAFVHEDEKFLNIEQDYPSVKKEKRYQKGVPLEGTRLLIINEGGLGDAMMYARYLEEFVRRGASIVFAVPKQLHSLFKRLPSTVTLVDLSDVSEVEYDFYTLASVADTTALLERNDPATGISFPYLFADPFYTEKWKGEIDQVARDKLRIGVRWQGTQAPHRAPLFRSVPLVEMRPFDGLGQLFSFQRDSGVEELKDEYEIHDLGTRFQTWEDTAGALANMDYLVTSCTSLAHLAGAMGIKTALIATLDPYFPWIMPGEKTEWYPSIRVFRQPKYNDWAGAVSAACEWIAQDSQMQSV